ncbi:aldose epimerase family protein [Cupriavidus campinensis]|uniref:Aldose epimerase n=1 Tax=Cupriavidus campinensis TaxID=151783 RepID=A0ABY3ENJ8_9BURK|nr:aldose epimerase [Cupriavidus campinensis]TSP12439.1 aldose epimerase [Cupriavidus campinensis]
MTSVIIERFQGQELARIGAGDNYLLLAPAHGGRLVRWVHRGQDILYWPDDADWSRVAKVRGGNPLLFPFIGRHFVDGEPGKWRDADGLVRELPQHGFARDMAFAVSDFSESAVSMTLASSDATRAGYPFDFVFTVSYRLVPEGLEAELEVRNTGSAPLPWYAGHHFYFALPHAERSASRLSLPPADRVRQTPDGGLTGAEPGERTYRLDDARLQDTFHVLRGPGTLRLQMPAREIDFVLNVPGRAPWHAITTWSEREDSDFYCVEPWLGLPNAIGNGEGLRWLAPGKTEAAVCRLVI